MPGKPPGDGVSEMWPLSSPSGSSGVDPEEVMAYINERYVEMQQEIRECDLDEYEDQLRVVALKGQQEELVELAREFDLGEEAR